MTKELEKALYFLDKGGVVIFPTETVFALACKISSAAAINRIYQIKKRDEDKPLSVLFRDAEQIKEYVNMEGREYYFSKYTPGPVTFILPCKPNKMLDYLKLKNNSLGVRIPDHEMSQEILQKLGEPIVATSVNFSGEKPASSVETIDKNIFNMVDYVLKGGESKFSEPSTVVDLTGNKPVVLRQGSLVLSFD